MQAGQTTGIPGLVGELRSDPTSGDWVIIAASRNLRPRHQAKEMQPAECPLCPGNEQQTPPEVLALKNKRSTSTKASWDVRVVPNRFAAVGPEGSLERRIRAGLFRVIDSVGYHEVVIETNDHAQRSWEITIDQLALVFDAWRKRYVAITNDPRIRYFIAFKNEGRPAGGSLEHQHSQIIATAVVPARVKQRAEVAWQYYQENGRNLYHDLIEAELLSRDLIVAETKEFVAFAHFAATVPYEIWIVPRKVRPSVKVCTPAELESLAVITQNMYRALHRLTPELSFNMELHTAPVDLEKAPYLCWYLQILPTGFTVAAGFEKGTGMSINPISPEAAAVQLRDATYTEHRSPKNGNTRNGDRSDANRSV
jgi:UDPglucose--hexose-1-phosphate uridylyltransferase